jgi:inosine-uridine nucleoside N-ribohydrolase
MGNDVDDAIALAVLHALQSRGECRLIAVTITKDNPWAPVFVSLMNTFYGRPEIPIGIVKGGVTPEDGNYLRQVAELKGPGSEPLFPRRIDETARLADAVEVLRRALASEADGSVTVVQVGFSTNLARLLDSPPDSISPLSGRELAARKVRLLSVMGGNFTDPAFTEYNIKMDVASAQKLFAEWPSPIVAGGYEVGISVQYEPARLETDFRWAPDHPLVHAYRFYRKMPYREPLWDPASALYAVRPDAGYFSRSQPGTVTFTAQGASRFEPSASGRHRYLVVNDAQRAAVREAISLLASQPR